MLALSLKALRQANNRPDDVRIFLDHSDANRLGEVEFVRDLYFPKALIFHAREHVQLPSGMWNILNAIKQGHGADRVYLIEEDVVVRKTFFDWSDAQDCFVSSGRYHRPGYLKYTNPGACFHACPKFDAFIGHINNDLFADRAGYYLREFGRMDDESDLDDGLVRRFMRHHNLTTVYPAEPQCAHIGFMAYSHYRPWADDRERPIDEKISRLQTILATTTRGRYTTDFEPILD